MYYIVDKVLQIRLTGPHRRHRIIYSTVCIKLSEGLGEAVTHPVWVAVAARMCDVMVITNDRGGA